MALDIGIDLGTANIIITIAGKGFVLNEPSVVAYDKKKKEVVAVGAEAYKMIGRTPEYIVAVRPLKDGVISDNDMTEAMIREFIHMVNGGAMMKPRIVLCVPSSVTDVERRAVVEAAMSAGARKVFLIEEPIAALIGAGVDISKPNGTMVVDIGGGTADVAIVSFNGIVQSRSIKMAGNKFDQAIIRHITQKYKILIGEKTAEKAKMEIANVFDPSGEKTMTIRGRNLLKGLPESIEISDKDIYDAIHENAMESRSSSCWNPRPRSLSAISFPTEYCSPAAAPCSADCRSLSATTWARPASWRIIPSSALPGELTRRSRCPASFWTDLSRYSCTTSDNYADFL